MTAALRPDPLPRTLLQTALQASTATPLALRDGADLQAAIDRADPGDVIELAPGGVYGGNFTLPPKGEAGATIRPRGPMHAEGTRTTPGLAATLTLPKIITPNAAPAIATLERANGYRLIGLDVSAEPDGCNTLIALGSDAQTSRDVIPTDLVLDRMFIHGAMEKSLRRGVALNSARTAIIDSWIADCHENGSDSQAILGWTGPGPYKLVNLHVEAGHEPIMFGGGGDPLIVGLVPSDIEIRRVHLFRPLTWKGVWQCKNLFELKSAQYVLVEGCLAENCWADAQDGTAILMKSTNQGGSATWNETAYVTFRLNRLKNIARAFNFAGMPDNPCVPAHDISVHDNMTEGLGDNAAVYTVQGIRNLGIWRNTAVSEKALGTLVFHGPPNPGLQFSDNLTVAPENWGIYGDNTGGGIDALNTFAPDAEVVGNAFAGMTQRINIADYDSLYPPGNRFVRTVAEAAAFTDVGADVAAVTLATSGVEDGATPPVSVPSPGGDPMVSLRTALARLLHLFAEGTVIDTTKATAALSTLVTNVTDLAEAAKKKAAEGSPADQAAIDEFTAAIGQANDAIVRVKDSLGT